MAKRGTRKALSIKQEDAIAKMYGGVRSPTSGAAVTDSGDVRVSTDDTLFEAKYTGSPGEPLKRKPKILSRMEKIADEAYEIGTLPALALRFYWPESPLADHEGWIDLTVRIMRDDANRGDSSIGLGS